MPTLPHQQPDAGHRCHQFLEDLACAGWYSELLFAALELGIFPVIARLGPTTEELATAIDGDRQRLGRLLAALARLQLIGRRHGRWYNSQLANLYLLPDGPDYLGDFLLYRKTMQPGWRQLAAGVRGNRVANDQTLDRSELARRSLAYLRATDQLLRRKAAEIVKHINPSAWKGPVLDIGCGGGALSRALLKSRQGEPAVAVHLVELPDIIRPARTIYPDPAAWCGMEIVGDDFRDFSTTTRYGLVLCSNFLHAYGPAEARELLVRALGLLRDDGLLLIHDYFPDRQGHAPAKGALYDLAMMQNTYNGQCHSTSDIQRWLAEADRPPATIRDLESDSSLMLVGTEQAKDRFFRPSAAPGLTGWPHRARELGFTNAVLLPTSRVVTAAWVRQKCRQGCDRYGQGLQCPPHGMDHQQTRTMLADYQWALVVEGAPPGREFHHQMLALEKEAFLSGLYKAFAFIAGHCPVCEHCPTDGQCRFPDRARPSMEGAGMDVYATARRAGIRLLPVREATQYVKYIGLLLLR